MTIRRPATLALADGTLFSGEAYGADGVACGEAVFTTGMTGYQEVLTDPSYCGQIVTMTAVQIGNTGVNSEDSESITDRPQVAGFVVRDPSPVASNWRSKQTLDEYLRAHGIVAIGGVDTRRLTRVIRDRGAQNACIGTEDPGSLVDRARATPPMEGLDLVSRVTPAHAYEFSESRGTWAPEAPAVSTKCHVVAIDYGLKRNILRCLVDAGCRVTVVPASASPEVILRSSPDGIFLSNGPGAPAAVDYAMRTIRDLVGRRPIFGICLGHQLLARALGASTYKLKFGHRGLNQPVKDLSSGRVEITTQNHGFVVDVASLGSRARSTHLHLNDQTSEGLELLDASAFSVQFHPEAAAGPHDTLHLFSRFVGMILA